MADGPSVPDDGAQEDEGDPAPHGAPEILTVERESRHERRLRRERTVEPRTPDTDGPAPSGPNGFGTPQKILAALIAALLLIYTPALLAGLKKTPRNKIGISYGGGPFEGAHFQSIVKPGSGLFFNGWFDSLYLYPADQQNYIVSLNPRIGAIRGADSISAPTADRVQLTLQVALYFKLNTDLLRQFHEQLGLQYRAYTAAGWNNLLQDTFRQQIENSVQQETRLYTVAQLYGSAQLLVELQKSVEINLAQRLITGLGEPYFCAPTFVPGGRCDPPTFIVKQIDIPSSVLTAFQAVRTSAIQVQVLVNQVAQRRAEAAGIDALNAALKVAGENYVLIKAIESGQINFWILPSGSKGTGAVATAP